MGISCLGTFRTGARLCLLAAMCWAAWQFEPDEAAAAPATEAARSLSGTLVDSGGFPVRNAQIAAVGPDVGKDLFDRNCARSNTEGQFTLANIPTDANYVIVLASHSRRMAVIPLEPARPTDTKYSVDLAAGSATGWVSDHEGNAVRDAEVVCQISGPSGIAYMQKASGKTDASGRFGLGPLPAGPGWTISAELTSGESTLAVPIERVAGTEIPDLIQQAPAKEPSDKLAALYTSYGGRVVDEEGQPIAGVHVALHTSDGRRIQGLGTAVTDSQGRWSRRLRTNLDRVEVRLSHDEFIGHQFNLREVSPSIEALRAGSAVQVMKRGRRLSGVVRDTAGQAVGNALVAAGDFYSYDGEGLIEDSTTARTDRNGEFSIGGIPAGKRGLLVTAEAFAPAYVPVSGAKDVKPVEITLDAGRAVAGRAVDELGKPIANARIQVDDWTLPNSFRKHLARKVKSGADGRFTIPALPRRGLISASASAGNRMGISFEIGPDSDDVADVPLYPYPVIEGTVLDANTRQPVKEFSVTAGMLRDGWFQALRFDGTVEGKDGQFKRPIRRIHLSRGKHEFVAKIIAAGYAPAISPPVEPGKKYDPFVIELKKSPPFTGTIVAPSGSPASKARVFFVGPQDDTLIEGTAINEGLSYAPDLRATAADDGVFELPAAGENGRILFLHDAGYALLPSADVKPAATIKLTPWARIEGEYRPTGPARLNVQVTAAPVQSRGNPESRDRLVFQLAATTDATGRFVIEHVPAMRLRVGAWATYGPAALKELDIEAGQTVDVSLPVDGEPVRGRVDLAAVAAANPPADGAAFDTSTSWIRAVCIDPKPQAPDGVDAADWDAQFEAVMEGTSSTDLTIPITFADLRSDGSFAFDALAPGKYVLMVDIRGPRPPQTCGWGLLLATARREFTVDNAPLTLSDLTLKATQHPSVGSFAPDLVGRTATGQAFSLADLRGKYVVLDFWAGWCAPCRASQPALKTIYKKYRDKVSFAGLNFDYTDAQAEAAIESINSPWPQVLSGAWDGENATLVAYGVSLIPSLWLIDPQGKVAGKDLTSEQLEELLVNSQIK